MRTLLLCYIGINEFFVNSLVASLISLMLLHHIRDIKDPELSSTLEELRVVTEDAIEVDDKRGYVRYKIRKYIFSLVVDLSNLYKLSSLM